MTVTLLKANTITTGVSALVLALVFLLGGRVHAARARMRDEGALVSLGGGVSIAYVFVHMMPEMGTAREAYANSATIPVIFKGMIVYFVGLFGFMVYYGLDNLRRRLRERAAGRDNELDYRIHLAGYAVYVSMISYMLINHIESTPMAVGLYTVAMIAHFLTIDHSLHEQHGGLYDRDGRLLLAAMCLLGWGMGVIVPVPPYVLALMIAFVSGAIIMNSAIMEIPHRKDERFLAFMVGGFIYGLFLIPLG